MPDPQASSLFEAAAFSQGVLKAGQRERLWRCLEQHSPKAPKSPLQLLLQQQQQHQDLKQQQQHLGGGLASQGLQEELSAGQLSALRLQHYSTFLGFMSVQHNWRARALAARTFTRVPLL
jgi:hypothetical protein